MRQLPREIRHHFEPGGTKQVRLSVEQLRITPGDQNEFVTTKQRPALAELDEPTVVLGEQRLNRLIKLQSA